MPTNKNLNPDATVNLTGWATVGAGTLATTAEGARWKDTGSGSGRYLRIHVAGSRLNEGSAYFLDGLKIRRNSGTAQIKDIGVCGATYGTGSTSPYAYFDGTAYRRVTSNVYFPTGSFVSFDFPIVRATAGAYTSHWNDNGDSGFTGNVPRDDRAVNSGAEIRMLDGFDVGDGNFDIIISAEDGKPFDFTVTGANLYASGDTPTHNQIDTSDAAFTYARADNSLTTTFTWSDPNEPVEKLTWSWGDGTAVTTGTAPARRVTAHTFPATGIYTVRLDAENTWARTASDAHYNPAATGLAFTTQSVTVPWGPFVADFNSEANYLAVSVDASPSVAPTLDPITLYTWNWGDSSTSTGKLASHTYAQPGSYAVSLTISTIATQRTHTAIKTVVATAPVNPANYFTVAKKLLEVAFSPSITGAASYLWNFGDGSTSTVQSPTYAYALPGTYSVTLTVNGNQTTTQPVTVVAVYQELKDLTQALRLEVAVPPAAGVIYNRLKNPDGIKGAYGWQTPLAGSSVVGSSTSDGPNDKAVPGAKLIYSSSGAGTQVLYSTAVAVTAGQYAGGQFVCTYVDGFYRVVVEALNSVGAVVGTSAQTGYLGALGTAQRTAGYLLPAGTVAARLRINHYSNTSAGTPTVGKILQLRHLMLATATTAAVVDAVPYADTANWQNILGPTLSLQIDREALNVGTFSAEIADSALDPATSATIRPGQGVRLRVALPDESGNVVWENLYAGTLTAAKVAYQGKGTITAKSTRITLSAVDSITRLAQTVEPRGVALITELPELLEGAGVPYEINGSSGQVPVVNVVAYNDNASALDQVAITRDTAGGYAYVNRNDVLIAKTPQAMPTTVEGVVDEQVYSGIDATFNTGLCMNSVLIKWLRYTPPTVDGAGQPVEAVTEEIDYGPYENAASIAEWGFHPATFTMQGVENPTAIAAKAAAILAANAIPARHINSVTIPIRHAEDLTRGKALLDLYDLVQLGYARTSTAETARVTGITHTITPTSWLMVLEFSRDGAVAAPQMVASPPPAPVVPPAVAYALGILDNNVLIPNVTWTSVTAWTDTEKAGISYAAGVWTIKQAGLYDIAFTASFVVNTTGLRGVRPRINGVGGLSVLVLPVSVNQTTVQVVMTKRFVPGDLIVCQVYQNSGADLDLRGAAAGTYTTAALKRVA